MLIFLHLPKTAGKTLLGIIERQYSSQAVLSLYSSMFREELKMMPRDQIERRQLMMGHFYFGVHLLLPGLSTYLTMLRDPVDRIISHYYFVRSDPTHYLHPLSRQLGLEDYVMACDRLEPNNDQTRLLAGQEYLTDSGEWTPEMLPIAKQNLRDHFSFVGITEEFDRSLLLMKHLFGWKIPFYLSKNVTRNRPHKEKISKETLGIIQAYNKLDMELYSYGKVLFQKQLCSLENVIENELRWFQILNGSFNKVYRLASAAAGKILVM
jgi:hypothetical protein